jgi:anaphase-promoting complex subunit 3
VPRDLESLVMRTLAISPELRPQSMLSMSQELGKLTSAPAAPADEQPVVVTDRVPRKKTPYVAAGLLAAAVVFGVTWMIVGRMGATPLVTQPISGTVAIPTAAAAQAPTPATQPKPLEFAPTTIGEARAQPVTANAQPAIKVITVEKPVVLKPPAPKSTAPTSESPALAIAEAKKLLARAREASVAERYAEAEELYNRVRAAGLERPAALTGLAEVAFQRASYPEAVRLAQRAVEAGGGVGAKMVLGNSYFKLGKYDDAIAQYREVLQADAGHREARANLAAAEKRRGG